VRHRLQPRKIGDGSPGPCPCEREVFATPGDVYPRFRAAAVQAAPDLLDREATIDKLEALVARAAEQGADLVVLGESFVPAFPVWNMLYPPVDQHPFFRRLFDHAVEIPGPDFRRIAGIARRFEVYLSVGVTEKGPVSMGAMWNTNLLFDRTGRLLNRHRKLVPTWAEKLTWANGDGAFLRVEKTAIGRLGVLICGENTNPLARFALLAQGEQVHIATYPPAWPFRRPGSGQNYNLTEAIRIRSAAHAFEGKVFSVVAACTLSPASVDDLAQGDPGRRAMLESSPPPVSMILGPTGEPLADPLVGQEGFVVADIDLALSVEQKQVHDVVGHYNRFDVFRLEVNATPNRPVWLRRADQAVPDGEGPSPEDGETGAASGPGD
jgi:nitrilase